MKKVKSLLAVSAVAATAIGLASCGKEAKVEKYKNEVDGATFMKKFAETSLGEDGNNEKNLEIKIKYYSSTKEEYNGIKSSEESNIEIKATIDNKNKISKFEEKGSSVEKNASEKTNASIKANLVEYIEDDKNYVVDINNKSYYTATSSDIDDIGGIDNYAGIIAGYIGALNPESKYYFDESGDTKLFTVIPKSEDEEVVVQYKFVKESYKMVLSVKSESEENDNGNVSKESSTYTIEIDVKATDKTLSKPDISNFRKER